MILVGRFLSPFVRRTGVVLKLLGLGFEQRGLSTADDAQEILKINPVGRVPALILNDGDTLVDSAAIIDWALETTGDSLQLLPVSGNARRRVMNYALIAVGAMEKGVGSSYERNRRPKDKVWQDWSDKLDEQTVSALRYLEEAARGRDWLVGNRMTLADINAVVAYDFLRLQAKHLFERNSFPALEALSERCNRLPAFAETRWQG